MKPGITCNIIVLFLLISSSVAAQRRSAYIPPAAQHPAKETKIQLQK